LLEYVSDTLGLPAVSFAHPAASPCNNYLYFVSDMPGGIGGKDIWKATLTHQKGRPDVIAIENMGPDIKLCGR